MINPINILPKFIFKAPVDNSAQIERQLLRIESRIGRKLFGPIPEGHTREFFCLDKNTWIWHEEWVDNQGQKNVITTKYVIRTTGIIKSQNNQPYTKVDKHEAKNLIQAMKHYVRLVNNEYDRLLSIQSA